VIVPVRNEQGRIGDCLRALLQQAYPGALELIVVDDSSEDRSREESAAALGSRGRLLEAGPKPEGWTGKCWAAERGFQHSSGELVAFVDADTTLAPSALAETVGALLARGAAMVSLLTRYSMATASERALLPAFTIMQSCWLPISIQARVGRRLSWLTYAFGPCMVLTRSAYQSSGGHRGISSSQREDLALARAVAAKAGPVYLLKGSDLAQSRHYTSRAEVRSAWRRTYYPYSGHSLPVALAGLAGIAVVQLLPLLLPVLALTSRSSAVVAGSLVALAGLICLRVLVARWEGHPYSTILWHPVTWVLTLWFQLGSIGDGLRGRRPVWRGRALGAEVAGATSW
jgi:cellulose synthase/poly-beta-1,6-N-acetylglucosamine synthase-like glycosyltransferase